MNYAEPSDEVVLCELRYYVQLLPVRRQGIEHRFHLSCQNTVFDHFQTPPLLRYCMADPRRNTES